MAKQTAEKYTYRVEWSQEDRVHIASCLEFPSLKAHGKSAQSALKEIEIVVGETIRWLQEEREKVPEPFGLKHYKGNLTLRVPAALHKQLAIRSAEEGVSINQYVISRIADVSATSDR
ncbi:antitoxin HicB [Campylobacterota bacterium]|nr:antitoxin HicB [Campylobacterota bacterium]